jgi:signal peptidase II
LGNKINRGKENGIKTFMITKNLLKAILIFGLITISIGCDQVSKTIIRERVHPYQMIQILNDHITLTRVENSGAFLSAGDALPNSLRHIFLMVVPLIALSLGLLYIFSKPLLSTNMLAGFCFIIGGGIGNLFDRIFRGSVTDFLYVKFGIFHTGIFNLADVSIMSGMFIILIQFLLKKKYNRFRELE